MVPSRFFSLAVHLVQNLDLHPSLFPILSLLPNSYSKVKLPVHIHPHTPLTSTQQTARKVLPRSEFCSCISTAHSSIYNLVQYRIQLLPRYRTWEYHHLQGRRAVKWVAIFELIRERPSCPEVVVVGAIPARLAGGRTRLPTVNSPGF
jgi:hypothetical protein